ncbi:DUF5085 family protein [Aquibacillus kalidii]|uniref:DUF5085 family protein n=1 Tax=Aquibacillus kalidii TaxID=2762597 RepID=UPI0016486E6A|nr:DUF5085 family protein [Aquibacillus kalidii]
MINSSDSIKYKNVISKKYTFHFKDMEQKLKEFINEIDQLQLKVKGPLFYSLNNVPRDEVMHAEFFMPVINENVQVNEQMYFHSYYSIDHMISTIVYNDVEKVTEEAYASLFHYMEQNKLYQVTPIFHILSGDESLPYSFIKIGVVNSE